MCGWSSPTIARRRSCRHAPRAERVAALATAAVVGRGGVGAAVIGLRAANDGPEPEGQNWWLVAWLVTALAYSLAGVLLLCRPGRRLLGAELFLVGASSVIVALAVQYRGYEQSVPGPPPLAGAGRRRHVGSTARRRRPRGAGPRRRWCRRAVAVRPARRAVGSSWRSGPRSPSWRRASRDGTGSTSSPRGPWPPSASCGSACSHGAGGTASEPASDPLAGWLLAGVVVAWLAVVPQGLDDVDWSLADHDVVWAVLLIVTVPLLVVGALIDELRRIPSDTEQLSHRSLEWALLAAGIVVIYTVWSPGSAGSSAGAARRGSSWRPRARSPWRSSRRGASGSVASSTGSCSASRDDPLAVVQRIVDHVGTDTGEDLLPALARSLERGLRFDAVAIDLAVPGGGWERAASVGRDTRRTATRWSCTTATRSSVASSSAGRTRPRVRARDAQLLDQLAGPLGLAVSWVRLAADLRRSSLAVVSAREEERRRLRRDLHDGVGPTLTGVSLGLRTAVRQLGRADPATAVPPSPDLLARLADEVDGVVLEIKRIVRDLRPTALDQLGLIGAVAEFSRKLRRRARHPPLARHRRPHASRRRSRSRPTGS